jgi:hypothetical protein
MSLNALYKLVVSASLLLACGHAPPPAALPPLTGPRADYVTVIPEVTYSRTGQDAANGEPNVSSDEDVMAGILAIPPGAHGRHAPCTSCRPED